MNIPHFIGVFTKDRLSERPKRIESVIVNLDLESGTGTHWVAYKKIGNQVDYYDIFGNLQPPLEAQKYFHGCDVNFNYNRDQKYNTTNCGHLCLKLYHVHVDVKRDLEWIIMRYFSTTRSRKHSTNMCFELTDK